MQCMLEQKLNKFIFKSSCAKEGSEQATSKIAN